MFYSWSSGFLCTTFRALAKWNKIGTHFWIITAVKPKGKRCITSPLHSTHTFFLIQIKQIIYLFSLFFQARSTATIFANERDVISLTTRNLNMLCCRSMALKCEERKKFTHLQYDPILICLARNCKRTATAAVAALVQKGKIVGHTLKKRSWWSCLEKMNISCDTKPSAPLNGCRLLTSFTRGARNKT